MDSPHDIGIERLDGLRIRKAHQRLCREMEDEVRLNGLDDGTNCRAVANITAHI